jgi:2-polyprenyl-3-methyl-5-hydroxy-6-metoxy-1,4-benzoquinol methylase
MLSSVHEGTQASVQSRSLPGLSRGNSAKLYCLRRIAERVVAADREEVTVLDLGCGDASQWDGLLRRYPGVRYIGVEPSATAAAAARARLETMGVEHRILTASAYDIDVGPVDVVASFSVLEHVQRRDAYVDCIARNLDPDGRAFVNYDAGHFFGVGTPAVRLREHAKTALGRLRARVGNDSWYQRFVTEEEAQALFAAAGLRVIDAKAFNTDLKSAFKAVPEERQDEIMEVWLDAELALNDAGIRYSDELARTFRTRSFELART